MEPNKTILVGGVIIIAIGVASSVINNKPISKPLVGGVGFLLLASILDVFGGKIATLANALVWLAVVAVIITEGAPIFNKIGSL